LPPSREAGEGGKMQFVSFLSPSLLGEGFRERLREKFTFQNSNFYINFAAYFAKTIF